jgi:CheY-like chemotaxis protein
MTTQVVLLVEDNDDNRSVYAMLLRHVGYEVIEATDGEAAIEAVLQRKPHLVLLDISIPKIDGWTVGRMLKEAPATAAIPLVAVTAHAFQKDRALAVEIGFNEYLPKPVEPRDVVQCVQRLIGGPLQV